MLTEQIEKLVRNGVTDYFSGMAEEVDLWCAGIVLDLRETAPALRLHCVLPHEGQADGWSESARERYAAILKQADSVEYVSREFYNGCMIERNHRLVDKAGLMLAVCNGARRSGTMAMVNYARKLGRDIILIHAQTLQITVEHFGRS